jgi:hypothetical protein
MDQGEVCQLVKNVMLREAKSLRHFLLFNGIRPALYLKWEAEEKTSQEPWLILKKPAFQFDNLWM